MRGSDSHGEGDDEQPIFKEVSTILPGFEKFLPKNVIKSDWMVVSWSKHDKEFQKRPFL